MVMPPQSSSASLSFTSSSINYNSNILAATARFNSHFISLLKKQSKQNAITISDYILAISTEIYPCSHKARSRPCVTFQISTNKSPSLK
jgi:hypothetical protein